MSEAEAHRAGPFGYERMDEYAAILRDTAGISGRRQTMNDVFVGLNVVFLTAIGFLLSATNFRSWGAAVAVSMGSLGITWINSIWVRTIRTYSRLLGVRHEYIERIEREFRKQRSDADGEPDVSVGMFLLLKERLYFEDEAHRDAKGGGKVNRLPKHGFSRLEADVAFALTVFALGVAVVTILATVLVSLAWIQPPRL